MTRWCTQLNSDFFILFLFFIFLAQQQLLSDGLVQERRNSIANAMELRLSCINPPRNDHRPGPHFNIKTIIPGLGIPIIKIRQSWDHPILIMCIPVVVRLYLSVLRLKQDGCDFPDVIFKWIFLNENWWILIKISLNFVPRCPINNISALV